MFPPEFINRLDEIIYFNSLTREDLIKIIDVEIKKMTPRFEEIGYKLIITKDLKEKISVMQLFLMTMRWERFLELEDLVKSI
jgi:ATP-dependent Clp protease ATP-binding subunit ClpC